MEAASCPEMPRARGIAGWRSIAAKSQVWGAWPWLCRPHSLAAGALVGHGAQHHEVAQAGQHQAQVEGAGGAVGQLAGLGLLLQQTGFANATARLLNATTGFTVIKRGWGAAWALSSLGGRGGRCRA